MLEERLDVPVCMDHDARSAALGEYHFGAGYGSRSMVYVVTGTGVGAAAIIDGRPYLGEHGCAAEIGHVTVDWRGEPCPSCGSRGCVESFVSGPNLVRRYYALRRTAAGAPAGTETLDAEVIGCLAAGGDPLALQVMCEAGQALGAGIATAAMILGIDLFVVGGGVALCGDMLLEPARSALACYSYRSVAGRVRIAPAALGGDGPILGCGWQARQLVPAG
jgi:glucokinase